jgi:predicted extracellular nuclease
MRRYVAPALALALIIALGACRSSDPAKNDGPVKTDGHVASETGPGQEATIYDIMTGKIADKATVVLREVVVTAVDGYAQPQGGYAGDVYVQELKGGESSAIKLYRPTRTDGLPVTDLKPGDHVKVEGSVTWFTPSKTPFANGRVVKELATGCAITRLTSGTVPAPKELTVADVTADPSAAKWEFVLVTIKNVAVTKPLDTQYGEFEVGGALAVDDELFPYTGKIGECLSLTGVMIYFYNYKLLPREQADIATGSGCVLPPKITIQDVQNDASGSHPKTGTVVTVTGVVSAIDSTLSSGTSPKYIGFWIQDEAGGEYSGIYVYYQWDDSATAEKKPKVGQLIELTGKYDEYKSSSAKLAVTLGELTGVSWVDKGPSSKPPQPVVVTAADVGLNGTDPGPKSKQYEGVLVKLENVEVESIVKTTGTTPKDVGFKVKGATLNVENDVFDFMAGTPPTAGTKYTAVVGPLYYSFDNYKVMPRSAADLVK